VLVNPSSSESDLAAAGTLQQLAILEAALTPELPNEVAPLLSPGTRSWFEAELQASNALSTTIPPQPNLPNWHIVAPRPASELLSYYKEAQASYGVPWQYLAAIHLVETRMSRIHGNSSANAQGPMQFLPATWARYGNGGDIQSDHDSILAAARLLVANGAPGN